MSARTMKSRSMRSSGLCLKVTIKCWFAVNLFLNLKSTHPPPSEDICISWRDAFHRLPPPPYFEVEEGRKLRREIFHMGQD
jgi:hypothetical protein